MNTMLRGYFVFVVVFLCLSGVVDANVHLRVEFAYPTDSLKGSDLYIRGVSELGLNWNKGVKLDNPGCNLYVYEVELDTYAVRKNGKNILECKALVDDDRYQIGQNVQIDVSILLNETVGTFYIIAYPWFFSTAGRYEYIRDVYSPELKNKRDLVVYLPPSYDENPLKFHDKVLVAHDGQNLFNASTSFLGIAWECDKTIDLLVNEGGMSEIVMIGVDNTPDRDNELTPDYDPSQKEGGKGDLYLDFLESTVLPLAHRNYRISTYQDALGILGSSLGGLISCYAGWTRGTVYSKALCMSSSFWWNNESFLSTIMPTKRSYAKNSLFYLDVGTKEGDTMESDSVNVRDSMEKDYSFDLDENLFWYLDKGGQHNELYWQKRFHIPCEKMYPPQIEIPIDY